MKAPLRLVAAVFLCLPAFAANRFDTSHLDKIHRVADPQISPDGKSIVVVVSRPNYAEDRHDADLVLVDVSTGRQRQLTHDRRGISSARWSPAGDRLAFLATGVNNKAQIFVMPMTGGDAAQLTKSTTGVQQFAWRPDGLMIAFAASEEPSKRTGDEKFNDSFEVGNDDFLVREAPMPAHLWLIPSDGGEPRRLTSGTWTLPISHPPSSPASPIAWSPNGRSIAFVKVETPHSGDSDRSTLQILDIASGNFHGVTGRTKHEGYPVFSPDGSRIAYWFPRDGQNKNVNEIFVAPASGGEGVNVTRGIDRNIQRAIWSVDGKSLLVGANDGTTVGLWIQPLDGAARRVPLGKICPSSAFWVDVA
ncbi:MAG TPA: DPP IV N-terminal domain-containing protein, partial [Bryobacteraceae bacterium]|nr:DPP IV N-terminal domain-containing protein [Bryobacteraceae bacterium]